MAKQEAFLGNEELGDSLDSAEALLKKHHHFETSLAAQDDKISALDEFAEVSNPGHDRANGLPGARSPVDSLL